MARSDDILAELSQLGTDLARTEAAELHELLHSIAEAARRIFDAKACSLALLDEGQEPHVPRGCRLREEERLLE